MLLLSLSPRSWVEQENEKIFNSWMEALSMRSYFKSFGGARAINDAVFAIAITFFRKLHLRFQALERIRAQKTVLIGIPFCVLIPDRIMQTAASTNVALRWIGADAVVPTSSVRRF